MKNNNQFSFLKLFHDRLRDLFENIELLVYFKLLSIEEI